MPLPAIGAAAARVGAGSARAGTTAARGTSGAARTAAPKKTVGPLPKTGPMPGPSALADLNLSGLFSVEGLMMLLTAAILDLFGLIDIVPIVGTIVSFVLDIAGILLIGGWVMFFRQKQAPSLRQARGVRGGARIRKFGGMGRMAKILVRGGCVVGEFIPGLGLLPFWTGLVLFELLVE